MKTVDWPAEVNTKFYSKKDTPDDNAVITEFASGRRAVVLKNTRWQEKFTACLALRKGEEANAFWKWYKDALGGMAGTFTCDALGAGKAWRFTKTPEDGGGIPYREFSLEIEEV